jgi:uncharacterized protein (DUF4415 family)
MQRASKVNPELIDDENPEWTAADFARARPFTEAEKARFRGPHTIVHETDAQWEARKRKLNANGKPIGRPFKERPKVPVTMRLDADVAEFFRASGAGWQSRISALLAAHVKRKTQAGKRAK